MSDSPDYQHPLYQTLGGVALHIANEAARDVKAWRRDLRYSPAAAIEMVCERRRSIASCGPSPSFLWAHLDLDDEGVPVPEVDVGSLAHLVRIAGPKTAWRVSWPVEQMQADGPWDVVAPDLPRHHLERTSEHDWPLRTGIALKQRFLVETRGSLWRSSHEYDGYDSEWDVRVLYLDEPPALTYFPIHNPLAKIPSGTSR